MKFYNKTSKKAQVWVYNQADGNMFFALKSADIAANGSVEFSGLDHNKKYKARVAVDGKTSEHDDAFPQRDMTKSKNWLVGMPWNMQIDINTVGANQFRLDNHNELRYDVGEESAPHEGVMKFGIGKADITPAISSGKQPARLTGWGVPQYVTKVEQNLFARAFIIEGTNGKRIVIVVADIWSGSSPIKKAVIRKLSSPKYAMENVLITGTHTHSAPGGYTGFSAYDQSVGGWDEAVFATYVNGIFDAIKDAETNFAEGKIYLGKGDIDECGANRSEPAYDNNPVNEKDQYSSKTDKEMLLLKFVRNVGGSEIPCGALNW